MVAISPCINAHGIVELASGHFSPLGQYTSEPEPWNVNKFCLKNKKKYDAKTQSLTCRLMLSLLHGKQNLWWFTDGHCTKWVSSNRSWHNVHFNVGFGAGVGPAAPVVGTIPSGGGPFPILTAIPGWDCCASVDVTVVLDTCREPDERRPLDEPGKILIPIWD